MYCRLNQDNIMYEYTKLNIIIAQIESETSSAPCIPYFYAFRGGTRNPPSHITFLLF